MKHNYNIAISLALVFLMLLVPLFGLVAAQDACCIATQESNGWYRREYAPTWGPFEHDWTGRLLRTEGNIEYWELYSELMAMMMPCESCGAVDGGTEWVKMTIMWDTSAHTGQIIRFEHHGYNLMFEGWTGTIQGTNNPGFSFIVSGEGYGWYRCNCTWYNLIITGIYEGEYDGDNEQTPFVIGNSTCDERATLIFGHQPSVGGSLVPMDNMAVLSPYLALLVLVVAVSVTAAFVAKRRPFY